MVLGIKLLFKKKKKKNMFSRDCVFFSQSPAIASFIVSRFLFLVDQSKIDWQFSPRT